MKLFLLTAIDGAAEFETWDNKSFGHVVRAINEKKARELASKKAGYEGKKAWLDDKITTCEVLTTKGQEQHILIDFISA